MRHFLFAVGSSLAIAYWLIGACAVSDEALRQGASAVASVGATMLGFVLAILAILVSLADRRLIRNMHKTGHFRSLVSRLFSVAIYFGAVTVLALICLVLSDMILRTLLGVSLGFTASSVLQLAIAGRTLWRVLERLAPPDGQALD